MKIRVSEIGIGSCFFMGKKEMKRAEDGRIITITPSKRTKYPKVNEDKEVETKICSLSMLGVGMRKHPDLVVEIGDGNILKNRKRKS